MSIATRSTREAHVRRGAGTLLNPLDKVHGIIVPRGVHERYIIDDASALVGVSHSDLDFVQLVE